MPAVGHDLIFLENILSDCCVHDYYLYFPSLYVFHFSLNHAFLYEFDSLNVQNGKFSGWYKFSDSVEGDRRIVIKRVNYSYLIS